MPLIFKKKFSQVGTTWRSRGHIGGVPQVGGHVGGVLQARGRVGGVLEAGGRVEGVLQAESDDFSFRFVFVDICSF